MQRSKLSTPREIRQGQHQGASKEEEARRNKIDKGRLQRRWHATQVGTQQQNAAVFRSYLTAICLVNNQAAISPLNLPTLPKMLVLGDCLKKGNDSDDEIDENARSGGLESDYLVKDDVDGIDKA